MTLQVAELSDADLERMKRLVGSQLVVEQWNEEASRDSIRHYAWGIGDLNPLWLSETYAMRTRFQTPIAPPTFVYSVCDAEVGVGMSDGLQALHLGANLEFHRPIRLGERIRAESFLESVEERQGKRSGRLAEQTALTRYYVGSELVASVRNIVVCVARNTGTHRMHEPRDPHVYSDEELSRIESDVLNEEVRGARLRLYDGVNIGDPVVPVVKGPLDLLTMTAYYAGAIGTAGYRGVETRVHLHERIRRSDPSAPTNFDSNYFLSSAMPSVGHQDEEVARTIGMPGPYDNGNQRVAWMAHAVTNWMGDDADLLNLSVRIRQPNIFGDTQWIRGTVGDKFVDASGRPCVRLDLTATNQLGDDTTAATATVALPRL